MTGDVSPAAPVRHRGARDAPQSAGAEERLPPTGSCAHYITPGRPSSAGTGTLLLLRLPLTAHRAPAAVSEHKAARRRQLHPTPTLPAVGTRREAGGDSGTVSTGAIPRLRSRGTFSSPLSFRPAGTGREKRVRLAGRKETEKERGRQGTEQVAGHWRSERAGEGPASRRGLPELPYLGCGGASTSELGDSPPCLRPLSHNTGNLARSREEKPAKPPAALPVRGAPRPLPALPLPAPLSLCRRQEERGRGVCGVGVVRGSSHEGAEVLEGG